MSYLGTQTLAYMHICSCIHAQRHAQSIQEDMHAHTCTKELRDTRETGTLACMPTCSCTCAPMDWGAQTDMDIFSFKHTQMHKGITRGHKFAYMFKSCALMNKGIGAYQMTQT